MSSELHSRWGDVAITSPTEGSWNQWNQPAGFIANASTESPPHTRQHTLEGPEPSGLRFRSTSIPDDPSRSASLPIASAIPAGHFDENIQHRLGKRNRHRPHGLGIYETRHDVGTMKNSAAAEESCDEDDEQYTLGEAQTLSPRISPRRQVPGDMARWEDYESDAMSKSPPLSVTSRMRHCSVQSYRTESSTTMSATRSSRRTSSTAASSVSAPSLSSGTPRFVYYPTHLPEQPHNKVASRAKLRESKHREPELVAGQELVPSYEELFG